MDIFWVCSHLMVSSLLDATICVVKRVPWLALTTLGLNMSVTGSQTISALTPAASDDLMMAPRFPGFSRDSTTRIKGLSPKFISSSFLLN